MTVVFPVVPVSLLGLCPIGNLSDRDFLRPRLLINR